MTLVKAPIAQNYLAFPWTLKSENDTANIMRLQWQKLSDADFQIQTRFCQATIQLDLVECFSVITLI